MPVELAAQDHLSAIIAFGAVLVAIIAIFVALTRN